MVSGLAKFAQGRNRLRLTGGEGQRVHSPWGQTRLRVNALNREATTERGRHAAAVTDLETWSRETEEARDVATPDIQAKEAAGHAGGKNRGRDVGRK